MGQNPTLQTHLSCRQLGFYLLAINPHTHRMIKKHKRGKTMKILTFEDETILRKVMERISNTRSLSQQTECHYHSGTICLRNHTFKKYEKWLCQYPVHVEENITIRLHADEIPWGVRYIGAPRQWKKGRGGGIKIAVVDTGINRNHPDLRERVQGGIHIVKRSFGNPETRGHGTHVAGIIAASLNDWGIAGVAPDVAIYDVRAFAQDGTAYLSDIIKGIEWSIRNKMDIINMSFGTPQYSKALHQAIKAAHRTGIVLVASAGNNGGAVEYPARFPEVIAVGAVDEKGKLADFSARGPGLDVTAPGVNIKSTWFGNGFHVLSGTSMAAPHITGKIALRLSARRHSQQRS
jgi:subtilisin